MSSRNTETEDWDNHYPHERIAAAKAEKRRKKGLLTCAKCLKTKEPWHFYKDDRRKLIGRQYWCKSCVLLSAKAQRQMMKDSKTVYVSVKVKTTDRTFIRHLAKEQNMTMSEFMYQIIRRDLDDQAKSLGYADFHALQRDTEMSKAAHLTDLEEAEANELAVKKQEKLAQAVVLIEKLSSERAAQEEKPSERTDDLLAKVRRKRAESSQNSTA